jgi:Tfp pilus assembly protein PilV
MKRPQGFRTRGFALLEALIALLVAALALAAVVRLQGAITKGSGDAVARSEALTLAQERMEQLRTQAATWPGFTNLASADCADVAADRSSNTTFQRCVTVANTTGGVDARDVTVRVQWNDTDGVQQAVVLSSTIGWDDPLGQALAARPPTGTMIAPVGAAKRPKANDPLRPGGTANPDQLTKTDTGDDGKRYLTDLTGKVLIYLDPLANGQPQSFTVIQGRIYFDRGAGNKVPALSEVEVRLSSEGYCAQNPAVFMDVSAGGNSYRYFDYWCYVGPGWYGNVGVNIADSVNGTAANAKICVGDPAFNGGSDIGTSTSAHTRESATRTYRGFQYVGGNLFSTGVEGGSSYPKDGSPKPKEFPQFYGSDLSDENNFFNHHFLLTERTASCQTAMAGGQFTRNAGKYYCINPHHVATSEVCPTVWPNFGFDVSGGGVTTYSLEVSVTGLGKVTSSVGGIDCGSSCTTELQSGTEVTLTAAPNSGQSFTGWSGACSGTSATCMVTMSGARSVTAQFSGSSTTNVLTVSRSGTGSGSVTGEGINCGTDCTETFGDAKQVTLSASANSGSAFIGWSGACASAGTNSTCTVNVSGAVGAIARFSLSPCNTTISGSLLDKGDDVQSAVQPEGGSCTKDGKNTVNYSCNLTALEGTVVTLTANDIEKVKGNDVIVGTYSRTVTATCTSQTNVNF